MTSNSEDSHPCAGDSPARTKLLSTEVTGARDLQAFPKICRALRVDDRETTIPNPDSSPRELSMCVSGRARTRSSQDETRKSCQPNRCPVWRQVHISEDLTSSSCEAAGKFTERHFQRLRRQYRSDCRSGGRETGRTWHSGARVKYTCQQHFMIFSSSSLPGSSAPSSEMTYASARRFKNRSSWSDIQMECTGRGQRRLSSLAGAFPDERSPNSEPPASPPLPPLTTKESQTSTPRTRRR